MPGRENAGTKSPVQYIVLYRGINVSGTTSVKMETLRMMHLRLGHQRVQSYIQSGNIVLFMDQPAEAIARQSAGAFLQEFGFEARVIVVDAKRWESIVKGNPYAKTATEKPTTVFAGICAGEPNAAGLKTLKIKTAGSETFLIRKGIVYLHAPDGVGTSKFAAGMEKACGVPMTVRNWRTMEALRQMANAAT